MKKKNKRAEEQPRPFRKKDVVYYIAVTKDGQKHLFFAETERQFRRRWIWLIAEAVLAAAALTAQIILFIDKLG